MTGVFLEHKHLYRQTYTMLPTRAPIMTPSPSQGGRRDPAHRYLRRGVQRAWSPPEWKLGPREREVLTFESLPVMGNRYPRSGRPVGDRCLRGSLSWGYGPKSPRGSPTRRSSGSTPRCAGRVDDTSSLRSRARRRKKDPAANRGHPRPMEASCDSTPGSMHPVPEPAARPRPLLLSLPAPPSPSPLTTPKVNSAPTGDDYFCEHRQISGTAASWPSNRTGRGAGDRHHDGDGPTDGIVTSPRSPATAPTRKSPGAGQRRVLTDAEPASWRGKEGCGRSTRLHATSARGQQSRDGLQMLSRTDPDTMRFLDDVFPLRPCHRTGTTGGRW